MTKEHIITLVLFVALIAAVGAVDRLYLAKIRKELDDETKRAQQLEGRLRDLEETFVKSDPEDVVRIWSGKVVPWQTAASERTEFFNMEGAFDIEPIPEDVVVRFYYDTPYDEMLGRIWQDINSRRPIYFPVQVIGADALDPDQFYNRGNEATRELAEEQLRKIAYSGYVVLTLLDLGLSYIEQLEVWPRRTEYGGFLEVWTLGIGTQMTFRELVEFLERLRTSDRYFTVHAIRIENLNLMTRTPPYLQVQMLISQARFLEEQERREEKADEEEKEEEEEEEEEASLASRAR
ncbi:MAG TPA: hypothetical protein HPP77_03325 [Candidatus Hydrogenedentes bacterium]|nr:hypothetical protein [Candidatus Hydrogenedentota bacterium]